MKTSVIYMLAATLLLAACGKESELSPTYKDKNWFSITEDSDDPLDHLIYTIYQETGIPFFYNDTLGCEVREDRNGNSYLHYEMIRMGYNPDGGWVDVGCYKLSESRSDIKVTLEVLQEHLLPTLPPVFTPRSYLIVDSLWTGNSVSRKEVSVYRDLTTIFIGRADSVCRMDEQVKLAYTTDIRIALYTSYIQENFADELKLFYKQTEDTPYKGSKERYSITYYKGAMNNTFAPEAYGFLYWKAFNGTNKYTSMSKEEDVDAYLRLLDQKEDGWILENYKSFPVVLAKYEIMKKILEEIQ